MTDGQPPNEPQNPPGTTERSFTGLHIQPYDGALYLLEHLEDMCEATEAAAKDVEEDGGDPRSAHRANATERQAVSEVIRVLCAMTVEAAVNLLGVARLGEEAYYKSLGRKSIKQKLTTLFETISPSPKVELTEELLSLARELYAARNDFVHPKPRVAGSAHEQPWRSRDLASAKAAVESTKRFLSLMVKVDHTNGSFFLLALLQAQ